MRFKSVKERYCPCGCGGMCTLNYSPDGRFKGYSHRAHNCPTSYANLHAKNPAKGHKGAEHSNWRPEGSTSIVERDGTPYRLIKIGKDWLYEHRYVMEQYLGRPLLTYEHVHHKNHKDTLNNNLDNLELLSHSAHSTHHGTTKPKGWEVFYDGCLLCGTTEKKYCTKGLCITCANRTYRADNPDKIARYAATDLARHKDAIYARNRGYHHRVRQPKKRQARLAQQLTLLP
jgi:hypothetical protein